MTTKKPIVQNLTGTLMFNKIEDGIDGYKYKLMSNFMHTIGSNLFGICDKCYTSFDVYKETIYTLSIKDNIPIIYVENNSTNSYIECIECEKAGCYNCYGSSFNMTKNKCCTCLYKDVQNRNK